MKILLTFFLILLSVLSHGQSVHDSLLLYYPLSGNANDASGNGFDGFVSASLSMDRLGNPNEAYSFNGIDEYIDFPNVPKLKPELPVSFSFWVRLDDLQAENAVIFTTDFAQNNHSGIWMNLSTTGLLAISYGDATGTTTSLDRRTKIISRELRINTWYHVVGIVRGAEEMDIYVDCSNEEGTYNGTGGALGYTANPGSLGRKDGDGNLPPYYFKGALDDFRYWNRELTTNQIDSLCNNLVLSRQNKNPIQDFVKLYPNPIRDVLRIELIDNFSIEKIVIFNSFGQRIFEGKFQSEIDLESLQAGIYFLQIIGKDKRAQGSIKFTKE